MALKVFVTGSPGWLGTRFVELVYKGKKEYQREEFNLKCLVLPGIDIKDIDAFGIEKAEGDITRAESLKDLTAGCDVVVHIAGLIHPRKVKELYRINTEGTKNILNEAISSGVRRFVYISSNSPMGFNTSRDKLFTEEDSPNPYKAYGKSKYLAEQAVKEAENEGKIETVILRPCWFYGPRQPARQTTFFKMIKKGNPIIFGKGKNLRSTSYVDNTVQGIVLAVESEKAVGQLYWIADERPYETIQIYRTVAEILGVKKLKPRKIPAFSSGLFGTIDGMMQFVGMYNQQIHVAGEMAHSIACSIDKAKRELGYKPEIELREGMRRSIEWCRAQGINI